MRCRPSNTAVSCQMWTRWSSKRLGKHTMNTKDLGGPTSGKIRKTWKMLNPFRTAVPFWGQTSLIVSSSSPKCDCSPERVNWAGKQDASYLKILLTKKEHTWTWINVQTELIGRGYLPSYSTEFSLFTQLFPTHGYDYRGWVLPAVLPAPYETRAR